MALSVRIAAARTPGLKYRSAFSTTLLRAEIALSLGW
jgi:hypothetical protein